MLNHARTAHAKVKSVFALSQFIGERELLSLRRGNLDDEDNLAAICLWQRGPAPYTDSGHSLQLVTNG